MSATRPKKRGRRVLLKSEYEVAHGAEGDIHFEFPLPILLERLFVSYSFVFLGCSLATDQTVLTFMKVAQQLGGDQVPHQYAVFAPADSEARKTE